MIVALNQYWYVDLELDLLSTDIDLALSTGAQLWDHLNSFITLKKFQFSLTVWTTY